MARSLAIPLGIVVACEKVVHPIADVRWRAVDVMLDPPSRSDWRELSRGPGYQHYHAATLPLVLSAQNLMDYRVNLANGVPSVYVVVQARPGASADTPIDVRAISASPFAAELFSDDSRARVERVAMPRGLVVAVEQFIAECMSPAAAPAPQRSARETASETASAGAPFLAFGRLSASE